MVKNLPAMQKTWFSLVLCDDLEGRVREERNGDLVLNGDRVSV